MSKTATRSLLLGTLALASGMAIAADPAVPADEVERLSVSFFTNGFLARVAERVLADRTDAARLSGAYLQEETGLLWSRADNGTDLDWYSAGEFCDELTIADWQDWRMPTIDELEGLHEKRSNAIYKLPAEIRLTGCCPWSDSRNGDSSAWNFSFRYRKRFSGSLNLSFELRALCVRAATEEDVLFFEAAAEKEKEEKKKRRS